MAVVLTYEFPGVTQEQYEGTIGKLEVDPGEPPAGLLVHVSGPMDGGWQVIDVWESQADFDRFHEEELRHATKAHDFEVGEPVSTWTAHTVIARAVFEHNAIAG